MADMKILSISISEFGGLSNFRIDLSEGLNIVRGDNESGKSTLLLFVTYALYGLASKNKDNNDKDKSLSWSGNRAEGALEIESNGKKYRIYRVYSGKGTKSEATVTDIGSGELLKITDEPGVHFLGLSKKAFESCVWCGQARLTSIDGGSISETLSNLSLTADESVNAEDVIKRLKAAKKEYKLEKGDGGKIFDAEKKRSEAIRKAYELQRLSTENIRRKAERLELLKKKNEAKEKLDLADARCSAASTLKLLRRISELEKLNESIESDKKTLAALAERSGFEGIDPDENDLAELRLLNSEFTKSNAEALKHSGARSNLPPVDERAARRAEKIAEREDKDTFCERVYDRLSGAKRKRVIGIASALLAAVSAVLGILLHPAVFAATAIFAALAVALITVSLSERKETERELRVLGTDAASYRNFANYCFDQLEIYNAQKQASEAERIAEATAIVNRDNAKRNIEKKLSEYKIAHTSSVAEELDDLIDRVSAYIKEKKALTGRISNNSAIAARDSAELEGYDDEVLRSSLPHGVSETDVIREDLAKDALEAARKSYNEINGTLARTDAEINANKDCEDELAQAREDIEKYEALIAEYRKKHEVLDKALEAISQAYLNMKSNFAPKVRDGAGEYLGAISDGKYSRVDLSDKMEVGINHYGRSIETRNLSGGTADAVYISLRLALANQIFDGATPFFMDETLSQLDDTRASGVLRLVERFVSEGNQCLLFSCHKRECELCDSMGLRYNKIEL